MSFVGLVLRNLSVRKLRSAMTVVVVAVGVLTVVALNIVTDSIRSSALAILQTGKADFTIVQKGVSDILNSNVDEADVNRIRQLPGVENVVGALVGTTKLNSDNPLFIEIGLPRTEQTNFGVQVLRGRSYTENSPNEVMLGWRAARNLHLQVGDSFVVDDIRRQVVGIFSTGQALGDAGMMLPLQTFQSQQRQPGEVTLVFVKVTPGTNAGALRGRIDRDNPQLATIQSLTDFERADRSVRLISAAARGTTLLAIIIGAVIVGTTTMMTFLERIREFGVLSAVGWSRRRVLGLMMSEAGLLGLLGAALGVGLSFGATQLLQDAPSFVGVLHIEYSSTAFWQALVTAGGMILIGAIYPSTRAAFLAPLEALRHE